MGRRVATFLTLVVGLVAIALPIVFTLYQANEQALETTRKRTLAYAADVARRTDLTADQISTGIERIVRTDPVDPCSEGSLALMREIDLTSTYIQAFGHVFGERLVCSSLGAPGDDVPLGPVDVPLRAGATLRFNVKLPFAAATPFLLVERSGFAAIIHKEVIIDATTAEQDVSLAAFTLIAKKVLAARGHVKPEWIEALGDRQEITFVDDGHLVAAVRSKRYEIAGVAALPISYIAADTQRFAMWLVPIGITAGIVLALAVMYLARLRLAMPAVIKGALRRNEFVLYYQPVVDLHTGRWVGAEALIRWRRPDGQMVLPDVFIPVAEDSGLISRITERVIGIVGREAREIFRLRPDFNIAINLASADLMSGRTVELLRRLVRETGAQPDNFIVEATERGFMNADAARAVLADIRAEGIGVAIDDFGTGYSSLSYLESFKIDCLKLDKAFVAPVGTGAATSQVIIHMIEMAKALGIEMVAEGVENETQAQFLRESGVGYAQGWLFARPMPLADLIRGLVARPSDIEP